MRKLIRPTLGDGRPIVPRGPRKPAPPSATNAEAAYLLHARDTASTLHVHLIAGAEVTGRLDFYDRDCLKLTRDDGQAVLVWKRQVKYYWAERQPSRPANEPPVAGCAPAAAGLPRRARACMLCRSSCRSGGIGRRASLRS